MDAHNGSTGDRLTATTTLSAPPRASASSIAPMFMRFGIVVASTSSIVEVRLGCSGSWTSTAAYSVAPQLEATWRPAASAVSDALAGRWLSSRSMWTKTAATGSLEGKRA